MDGKAGEGAFLTLRAAQENPESTKRPCGDDGDDDDDERTTTIVFYAKIITYI